jgi:hypothetical protein
LFAVLLADVGMFVGAAIGGAIRGARAHEAHA